MHCMKLLKFDDSDLPSQEVLVKRSRLESLDDSEVLDFYSEGSSHPKRQKTEQLESSQNAKSFGKILSISEKKVQTQEEKQRT